MGVGVSVYQIPRLDSWQISKLNWLYAKLLPLFLSQLSYSKINPVIWGDLS